MNRPRQTSSNRGSVLIVVLWASAALVSITLLFGHSMLMTYRGSDNDLAGRQAELAVEGGMRYAEALLLNPQTPGVLPDPITYEAEAVPVGDAKFWIIGRGDGTTNTTTQQFALVDEAGKLNLNTATLAMLEGLPGMTEELAASIIDWRDADDTVTPSGAESSTYLQKKPAYNCKNAPFESIEELALVNGATRQILYGEDANLNGLLDANEDDGEKNPPSDNSDGKLDPGILDYVTVFSRESNKQSDGTARINIGQPGSEAALTTLLTDKFGAARAQEIRQRIGPAGVFRSALEFYMRSGMKADEFGQIVDALTVKTGDYLTGLINVNTASATVLGCIPGIGTDKASAVITARQSRSTQDTNIAWVAEVLGQQGAMQAGPYITGQSWQVSADVAAVGRHGRGFRRTRFVIDMSTGKPQVVYRRNLAPLGWALGADVRQSLAANKEGR
jgi:type II secretory pathway component PulK